MPPPIFTGVHFWVADMAATLAFYRAIGFAIPPEADGEDFVNFDAATGAGFQFATPSLTNGYHAGFEASSERGASCLQFSLQSREAVDALYQQLTGAGYVSHLEPIDAFWGARYAELLDPDGNAVGFHSPRDPDRVSPPPLS